MSYGICYGTESEPTTQQEATNKDKTGNYTATLRALQGNTIYYYRPYIMVDGEMYYGQTSSFQTKEDNVVTTGDADTEGYVRSHLTIGGGAYRNLNLGLCWSASSEEPTINDMTAEANETDDENYYKLRISITGTIHYRAYIKIDGVAHYGAIKTTELARGAVAVDLGLPSGLKWASCNVGATSPEEYGNYYAWGETKPKSNYSSSTYKWYRNGSFLECIKYSTYSSIGGPGDNKTVLELEDDAAQVNWGGTWRMPTLAEQEELRKKCTWVWSSLNGVNGYMVTGPSGNSIFLPAGGIREDSTLPSTGSVGFYWSSSLCPPGAVYAYCIWFFWTDKEHRVDCVDSSRTIGRSVRPVCQ